MIRSITFGTIAALASTTMLTTAAHAGAIERSTQSVNFMFESGNYAELGFSHVDPSISGQTATQTGPFPPGTPSGNMVSSYNTFSLAYKQQINDALSFGLTIDNPIGADVAYPLQPYPFAGATAPLDSTAVTGFVKYTLPSNFSILGGVRAQRTSGSVANLPDGVGGTYRMSTSTETDYGYILGVAYERPDIALRVALTYQSEITHDFDVMEQGAPSLPFSTTVPESWNLEFQSGVAKDTLVFGSIRHRTWSDFNITPAGFKLATGASLVNYQSDITTYTLGVGRKFSENWSGALILGYEGASGDLQGNLGPEDGRKSIALAATYTMDNIKITGGINYTKLGDATTATSANAGPGGGPSFSRFTDNHAVGVGIKIGYSF